MSSSFDSSLPEEIREKLAELELELSEGDITQKGYEKKRSRLLQPFLESTTNAQHGGGGVGGNASVKVSNDGYYNLKNQHLVNDDSVGGIGIPEINGSEICVTNDGYSYVDEIHSTGKSSSHSQHSRHQHSSSAGYPSHHHYYQNHRVRRTQRRITHNEKRYHSGLGSRGMLPFLV